MKKNIQINPVIGQLSLLLLYFLPTPSLFKLLVRKFHQCLNCEEKIENVKFWSSRRTMLRHWARNGTGHEFLHHWLFGYILFVLFAYALKANILLHPCCRCRYRLLFEERELVLQWKPLNSCIHVLYVQNANTIE